MGRQARAHKRAAQEWKEKYTEVVQENNALKKTLAEDLKVIADFRKAHQEDRLYMTHVSERDATKRAIQRQAETTEETGFLSPVKSLLKSASKLFTRQKPFEQITQYESPPAYQPAPRNLAPQANLAPPANLSMGRQMPQGFGPTGVIQVPRRNPVTGTYDMPPQTYVMPPQAYAMPPQMYAMPPKKRW